MLRELLQEISYSGATNPFDMNLKKHLELCVRNTQTNTVIYIDLRASSKSAGSPKRGRSIRWIDQVKSNNSAPMKSPEIGPTIKIMQRPVSMDRAQSSTDSAALNFAYCLAESETNLLHSDILAIRYDNQQMEQLVRRTDLLLLPPLPTTPEPQTREQALQYLHSCAPALQYLVSACAQVLAGGAPAAWLPNHGADDNLLPLSPGADADGCQWQVLNAPDSPKANLHISSPLPRIKRHLPKPRRASASRSPEPGGDRRPVSSPEVFQMYGRDLVEDLESFFIDGDSDGSGPDADTEPARPMVLSEFGHVGPSASGAGRPGRPHGLVFGGGADDSPLPGGRTEEGQGGRDTGPSSTAAGVQSAPAFI
jgi:hypothetical protein